MKTVDKIKIMQAYLEGHKIQCVSASGVGAGYTFHISSGSEPCWNFAACDYTVLPKESYGVMAKEQDGRERFLMKVCVSKEEAQSLVKEYQCNAIRRAVSRTYHVVKVVEEL